MTNKQYPIIEAIKTALQTLVPTYIKKVLEYPDDISKAGQNFPAVIVRDGNETYTMNSGEQYIGDFQVHLDVMTSIVLGQTKQHTMLDVQAKINDIILNDVTLGATCVNIRLTEVIKDNIETQGQQIDYRRITYTITFFDTR
jgi:hypothetical protein